MAQACNPSTLEGRGGWITRSRDQDHPGQNDETPSLLKTHKKIAGHGGMAYSPSYPGGWDRRIAWTCKAEVAVSWDHATALQPGAWWHSKTLSKKWKQNQGSLQDHVFGLPEVLSRDLFTGTELRGRSSLTRNEARTRLLELKHVIAVLGTTMLAYYIISSPSRTTSLSLAQEQDSFEI